MRKCVVILGSGRSGTSLLMKTLNEAGMSVSESMTEPSEQNREGGFEDSEIFQIHSNILGAIGAKPSMPLPDGWMQNPYVNQAIVRLGEIAVARIDSAASLWGFKDPRVNCLLPLWTRIFNRHKIVPTYVLALRDPEAVVQSLNKQYWIQSEIGELIWLQRNMDAILNTTANLFIHHYEDLVNRKDRSATEALLQYVGLAQTDVGQLIEQVVDDRANRAVFDVAPVKNAQVTELYGVLVNAKGADFDRRALLHTAKTCRTVMGGYKGWQIELHNEEIATEKQVDKIRSSLSEKQRKYSDLKTRSKLLASEHEKLLKSLASQKEEHEIRCSHYDTLIESKSNELDRVKKKFFSEKEEHTNTSRKLELAHAEKKHIIEELKTQIETKSNELECVKKKFFSEKEEHTNTSRKLELAHAEKKHIIEELKTQIETKSNELECVKKKFFSEKEEHTNTSRKLELAHAEKKNMIEEFKTKEIDIQRLQEQQFELSEREKQLAHRQIEFEEVSRVASLRQQKKLLKGERKRKKLRSMERDLRRMLDRTAAKEATLRSRLEEVDKSTEYWVDLDSKVHRSHQVEKELRHITDRQARDLAGKEQHIQSLSKGQSKLTEENANQLQSLALITVKLKNLDSEHQEKVRLLRKRNRALDAIHGSKTYRASKLIKNALVSPGVATFMLPFSLIGLVFSRKGSA